jgi:hypothetical protein
MSCLLGDTAVASSYLRHKLQLRADAAVAMGRGEAGVLGPPPPPAHIATGTGTILDDPVRGRTTKYQTSVFRVVL